MKCYSVFRGIKIILVLWKSKASAEIEDMVVEDGRWQGPAMRL